MAHGFRGRCESGPEAIPAGVHSRAYQVSTRVNAPKNNDPALIEPVDNPISDDPAQIPLIQ
jgi:hypothetical protein